MERYVMFYIGRFNILKMLILPNIFTGLMTFPANSIMIYIDTDKITL